MEKPVFILFSSRDGLILLRDNYPDFDILPLPSVFEFDWPEKTAKVFTNICNMLLRCCKPSDGLFYDEITDLIYKNLFIVNEYSKVLFHLVRKRS